MRSGELNLTSLSKISPHIIKCNITGSSLITSDDSYIYLYPYEKVSTNVTISTSQDWASCYQEGSEEFKQEIKITPTTDTYIAPYELGNNLSVYMITEKAGAEQIQPEDLLYEPPITEKNYGVLKIRESKIKGDINLESGKIDGKIKIIANGIRKLGSISISYNKETLTLRTDVNEIDIAIIKIDNDATKTYIEELQLIQ